MTSEPSLLERGEVTLPAWYADRGREWFCRLVNGGVVCESRDGWKTAADLETFARWGWTLLPIPGAKAKAQP